MHDRYLFAERFQQLALTYSAYSRLCVCSVARWLRWLGVCFSTANSVVMVIFICQCSASSAVSPRRDPIEWASRYPAFFHKSTKFRAEKWKPIVNRPVVAGAKRNGKHVNRFSGLGHTRTSYRLYNMDACDWGRVVVGGWCLVGMTHLWVKTLPACPTMLHRAKFHSISIENHNISIIILI